jgi:ATP-dependent DNA helicase DinG
MNNILHDQIARTMRDEIEKAYDNEVLFFGWTDEDNRVNRVEVKARGTKECVAVPLERCALPDVIIHNHPDGTLTPSDADMTIASFTAKSGVGFFIVNNDVTDIYVAVEPVIQEKVTPLDTEKLVSFVSEGGICSGAFPNFEEREGQKEMITQVCKSFNENAVALIEAGTGIGKSVAYLLPSIEWAIRNRERVVISTNTINLQEQLLYKDIPDLRRALTFDFSYVLMKGRGNYVCLDKLYEVQQDLFSLIDDDELEEFSRIEEWLRKTDDGSLSDLNFIPKQSLWEKINSGYETCSGMECKYFSRCFQNRVRRKAATADLIITNHHYLLADASLLGIGGSILPSYERVIFDEAHNLEEAATSFFTKKFTLGVTIRLLNRLYSGGRKKRGYLFYLLRKLESSQKKSLSRMVEEVTALKSMVFELFQGLEELFARLNIDNGQTAVHGPPSVIEADHEVCRTAVWESCVVKRLDAFYRGCSGLVNGLLELRTDVGGKDEDRVQKQIDGFILRLSDILQTIDVFLKEEDSEHVRWLEKRREPGFVVALIDVGTTLYDLLFKRVKSSVLTSASLTVKGDFEFLKQRLSLSHPEIEVSIASPFDFDGNMAVLIPTDTVEPADPNHTRILRMHILEILTKTKGKAFVLFTSYKTMNEVYEGIKDSLTAKRIISFKQGTDSRTSLFNSFKNNVQSVLFGTESFWEGVDAPGETLECVIMTKLPFKVPTEPIFKARLERVRARGGNPFLEYSLPLAVVKFKQGIGRLIRNKTDTGIVVLLDRRILMKSYGRVFVDSLPGGSVFTGELSELLQNTDRFLSNNSLTN